MLGDVANLAARIMGTIKGAKMKNEIRCDLNTRMLAGNYFDFVYTQHYELKGKSISIPFYKPLNPALRLEQARNKVLSPDQFLSVHMNPLNLERNTEPNKKIQTLGFQDMRESLAADIAEYYSDENEQNWPYLAVIKGEVGSGKTAFARNLIDDLHKADEFGPYLRANKNKLPIFASAVNPETQYHFLNAWKPIM